MKLGELLISAGKLTPAQVEETLKGQAIFGGKFGTNLIEMGYLDEQELTHFLSRKTGTPHASPDQLMEVPPHILKLIPEQIVKKYRVVPIGLNQRKLIVAMADPTDFAAIDEISFVTGYIVLPVITPELRLVTALEKHYKIRREMRYIKVEGGGRNRAKMAGADAQAFEPARDTVSLAPAQAKPAQAQPVQPKPQEISMPTFDLEEGDILDLPALAEFDTFAELEELQLETAPAQPAQPAPQAFFQQEPAKDYSWKGVLQGFTKVDERDEVADLVINYVAQQFDRAALFLLKEGKATGWVAQVAKKPVPNFEKLEIALGEPSILRVVSESRTFYLGPIPMTPANGAMIAALGGGTPSVNLLVPLMMVGRVVAILYVEGGSSSLDERVPDLQKLLGKASLAFEILILKSKILLT